MPGDIHDYLGMTLNYSTPEKVTIWMDNRRGARRHGRYGSYSSGGSLIHCKWQSYMPRRRQIGTLSPHLSQTAVPMQTRTAQYTNSRGILDYKSWAPRPGWL
jgi:hypothetical protein